MQFSLDLIEHKVELFEAYSMSDLESKIEQRIEENKALMLEPYSVQHQVTFNPTRDKMLYTASVHFKLKR